MTAQTDLVVDGGFVSNIADDQVQLRQMVDKGVERNPVLNTASYYGFKPFNLAQPGQPIFATFYQGGRQLFPAISVKNRYVCNAYAYAGPTVCTTTQGIYEVWVSGIDYTGNLWNRMYLYLCDASQSKITIGITGQMCPRRINLPTDRPMSLKNDKVYKFKDVKRGLHDFTCKFTCSSM